MAITNSDRNQSDYEKTEQQDQPMDVEQDQGSSPSDDEDLGQGDQDFGEDDINDPDLDYLDREDPGTPGETSAGSW